MQPSHIVPKRSRQQEFPVSGPGPGLVAPGSPHAGPETAHGGAHSGARLGEGSGGLGCPVRYAEAEPRVSQVLRLYCLILKLDSVSSPMHLDERKFHGLTVAIEF